MFREKEKETSLEDKIIYGAVTVAMAITTPLLLSGHVERKLELERKELCESICDTVMIDATKAYSFIGTICKRGALNLDCELKYFNNLRHSLVLEKKGYEIDYENTIYEEGDRDIDEIKITYTSGDEPGTSQNTLVIPRDSPAWHMGQLEYEKYLTAIAYTKALGEVAGLTSVDAVVMHHVAGKKIQE